MNAVDITARNIPMKQNYRNYLDSFVLKITGNNFKILCFHYVNLYDIFNIYIIFTHKIKIYKYIHNTHTYALPH